MTARYLTFGILNDLGVVSLHDGHARVGGAQVDPDHVPGHPGGGGLVAGLDQVVLGRQQLGRQRGGLQVKEDMDGNVNQNFAKCNFIIPEVAVVHTCLEK